MTVRFRIWIFLLFTTSQIFSAPSPLEVYVDKLPADVDHASMIEPSAIFVINQVCQRLIIHGVDGSFIPELAQSWTFENKGRILKLKLNRGAYFKDGTELTARDVQQTIKRIVAKNVVQGFKNIVGAKTSDISGIKIIGTHELNIFFTHPNYSVLHDLADPHAAICRYENQTPYGTGDYKITQTSPARIEFESQNPAPHLIHKFALVDQSGPNVGIFVSPHQSSESWRNVSNFYLPQVKYLAFNSGHPDFITLDQRKSFARVFAAVLLQRGESFAKGGFFPLGLAGHNPDLRLDLQGVNKFPRAVKIATYRHDLLDLANQTCIEAKRYNTKCDIEFDSFKALAAKRKTVAIYLGRISPTIPSVADLLPIFRDDSEFNFFFSKDTPVKRKVQALSLELERISASDISKLADIARAIDKILLEEVIVVPFQYGSIGKIKARDHLHLPPIGALGEHSLRIGLVRYRYDV